MLLMWFLAMTLCVSTFPSEAYEAGPTELYLFNESPGLQKLPSDPDSQSSMLGTPKRAFERIRYQGNWSPLNDSLDLELRLGRDLSEGNKQEFMLKSQNFSGKSTDHASSSCSSWSNQAQPKRRVASNQNDQLVPQNFQNAQDPSTIFLPFLAEKLEKIPTLNKKFSNFESEKGVVPSPPTTETRKCPPADPISFLKQPKNSIIGFSQAPSKGFENFPAPFHEGPVELGKRKSRNGNQSPKCPEEIKRNRIDVNIIMESYPEEKENRSLLQVHPEICRLPFTFENKKIMKYFETIQCTKYKVRRFDYGKPKSLRGQIKDYSEFHNTIWKHSFENGKRELSRIGIPSDFKLQAKEINKFKVGMMPGSLRNMDPFSDAQEWIIYTLPKTIHDVRIVCQAFPKVFFEAHMTVKQLQVNAWNFLLHFCNSIGLIYSGSEEVLRWIYKSSMSHADIKILIDKLNEKIPRFKEYKTSSSISRSLLLLWMSFYCRELYFQAKGSNGCLNLTFSALLNEFYDLK